MFKFQAVLARTQQFLSRSVEKRGDQSRFKCRKRVNYYAIRSTYLEEGDWDGELVDAVDWAALFVGRRRLRVPAPRNETIQGGHD